MQTKTQLLATAQDLELLRTQPNGAYMLIADIDLQGICWHPVGTEKQPFYGTLQGNGHKISNVNVCADHGAAGFFGVNAGTVSCLNLENLTIQTASAESVGAIAGENRGDISAVNVKNGKIDLVCAQGQTGAGTVAGRNSGLLRNCVADVQLHVDAKGGTVYTGGLVGISEGGLLETLENCGDITLNGENIYAGLYVGKVCNTKLLALKFSSPMNLLNGSLYKNPCAEKGERTVFDGCIWRDNSNSDRLLDAENYRLRSICEAHMRKMGTHIWSPDRELHYICSCGGAVHNQDFYPGTVYHGVPYTHKHRSYEQFLDCFREDGTLQPWLKANGWDGFDLHMGCDCSGAIYWSWSKVSPDLTYRWTGRMIPHGDCGTLPVGDYTWETDDDNTRRIKEINTPDKIADCVAQMHKGDVFLRSVISGHVRMCVSNPVIYRAPDGRVDFMSSYAITHEQGDGLYPKNRPNNSSWLIDHRYNLTELVRDDYIPITTAVLVNGAMPEPQVSYEGPQTVNAGLVRSNFRITATTVQVKDSRGDSVWEKTLYTSTHSWAEERRDFMPRNPVKEVDLDEYNIYWGSCHLQAGQTYSYEVSALLSTGDTYPVTHFTFTA